jgi:hypothetical protein
MNTQHPRVGLAETAQNLCIPSQQVQRPLLVNVLSDGTRSSRRFVPSTSVRHVGESGVDSRLDQGRSVPMSDGPR